MFRTGAHLRLAGSLRNNARLQTLGTLAGRVRSELDTTQLYLTTTAWERPILRSFTFQTFGSTYPVQERRTRGASNRISVSSTETFISASLNFALSFPELCFGRTLASF